ncbi:hypothetical protein [Sulfurimonas sp. HSL-1716]|uniref:hypothetical protein n=1 Tax=Hydrocurvibacter sulfurireducens TaxID=3131937 RepID=UPI0031F8BA54
MIEEDLFSHLSMNVPLVNERVYPLFMPENCKKPAIVYTLIIGNDQQSLNSAQAYGSKYMFQIDIYATTYPSVKAIKEQVKEALYSFSKFPHNLSSFDGYEEHTKLFRETIEFNF